jgi:hypothetical protein
MRAERKCGQLLMMPSCQDQFRDRLHEAARVHHPRRRRCGLADRGGAQQHRAPPVKCIRQAHRFGGEFSGTCISARLTTGCSIPVLVLAVGERG